MVFKEAVAVYTHPDSLIFCTYLDVTNALTGFSIVNYLDCLWCKI
jgi:hypothetical protein